MRPTPIHDRVSHIVVDDLERFQSSLLGVWEVADYGKGLCFTKWPYKRVPIKVDAGIGEHMVALYEKHFDGYGQIKRWNYVTKEVWDGTK